MEGDEAGEVGGDSVGGGGGKGRVGGAGGRCDGESGGAEMADETWLADVAAVPALHALGEMPQRRSGGVYEIGDDDDDDVLLELLLGRRSFDDGLRCAVACYQLRSKVWVKQKVKLCNAAEYYSMSIAGFPSWDSLY